MPAMLLLAGCESSAAEPDASATGTPERTDAGTRDQVGTSAERMPVSRTDAALPEGPTCTAATALWCDGAEDCPYGGVCCGAFDTQRLAYPSTQCQASCDPMKVEVEFCHAHDPCSGDNPNFACRRSRVLPMAYAICAVPNENAPVVTDDTAARASGTVACGEGICAPGQACCVRTIFDPETRTDSWPESYCIDDPADCSCAGEAPRNTLGNGGDIGAAQDEDAGTEQHDDAGAENP